MANTNYKEIFKGKKITVMGLGLLGGAVNDVKFLAEAGADLIVTDLKTEKELEPSLKQLKKYSGIKYILGEHRLEDFRERDIILQPGNVPTDSPYLKEARANDTPILESEALFVQLAQGVKIVGVTGTRGKSTVTHLVYETLKASGARVHLGGNVKGVSTMALLKNVKPGDVAVLELDSWSLNGLGVIAASPNISVFTNFMDDHMNFYGSTSLTTSQAREAYFADKANIYKFQKKGDVLFTDTETLKEIQKREYPVNGKLVKASAKNIPTNWKVKMPGEHNRKNAAYAVVVAKELGIKESIVKKVLANFAGLPGRLEVVREVKGVTWINDTNGTTPDAVVAALKSYENKKGKIVLIGGGADKQVSYAEYAKIVPKYVKALVLLKGTASDMVESALPAKKKFPVIIVDSMINAVSESAKLAKKGDVVILSPGAASFGMFKNEYDRGDQFVKAVKKLK